jgi:hypothetical protein
MVREEAPPKESAGGSKSVGKGGGGVEDLEDDIPF